MRYKIDPITGQMVKNDSELAIPTTKPFNSNDYIGYSKDFDKQSPEVSKLDSLVPNKVSREEDPKNIQQTSYETLKNLMRSPASDTLRSIQDQKQKNQEEYMNRPASREDEDRNDGDFENIKVGTPAHENRVLAQGWRFSPEQESQMDAMVQRQQDLDKTPDKGGAEWDALDAKYEELNNYFRQQNKNDYWKNK